MRLRRNRSGMFSGTRIEMRKRVELEYHAESDSVDVIETLWHTKGNPIHTVIRVPMNQLHDFMEES